MATVIRAEISSKNKYWIDKHRHYELKHFCLQYPSWKKAYHALDGAQLPSSVAERIPSTNIPSDPTAKCVMLKDQYLKRIRIVEEAAMEADDLLHDYILKAVTEGLSYTYLQTVLAIPCSRDTYYDRYRKFFWLLSKARD